MLKFILAFLFAAGAAFLALPSKSNFQEYSTFPEPSGFEGPFAPNNVLADVEKIGSGIKGAETVIFDADGTMFGFTADGWIITISIDGKQEKWAYTGGRPLSGKFDENGDIIVTIVPIGLCKVSRKTKQITILANIADNLPIYFANNLDIDSEGKIYFSDSMKIISTPDLDGRFDLLGPILLNMLEGSKAGRLLCYDPKTGSTKVLMTGLFFANGVVLSENEEFVLIAETLEMRVSRYWLKGKNAGKSDVFVSNLPGHPDNLSPSSDGNFYIAIATPPSKISLFARAYPFIRSFISKLPIFFWPSPSHYGLVIKISADGKTISSLQDPSGKYISLIASVTEHDGVLYFGSFKNDYVGRLKL